MQREQAKEESDTVLSKSEAVLLCALLGEIRISNLTVWECLQADLKQGLLKDRELLSPQQRRSAPDEEGFSEILSGDFASFSVILDCIFRACLVVDPELLWLMTSDLLETGLLRDLDQQDPNQVIKVFRALIKWNPKVYGF